VGLNGFLHRSFLSDFYSGRFPGTFARGATFQFNPKNNDRRISGSLASLAGLEVALEKGDWREVDLAVRRIILLHSMILAFGGIPLLYMGDELGLLNDDSYLSDPNLAADNRWLHRPRMDWELVEKRADGQSVHGRIFQAITQLIHTCKQAPALHAQAAAYPVWTHNETVFGLLRQSPRGRLLVLGNFSEKPQPVPTHRLHELGFSHPLHNRLTHQPIPRHTHLMLAPYESIWLEQQHL
jgi:amylosucrase